MKSLIRRWWFLPDNPPTKPGCFVVPSYALVNRTTPTLPTKAQIKKAYKWWRKYPTASIIMSTGDNQGLGINNSKVMVDYAHQLGIPMSNLIEENQSKTTYQNLLFSLEIIEKHNFKEPTLVTLDLYTRRAVATAKKLKWEDFYWLSVYSPGQPAYGYKYFQTYSRLTIFCYEVCATIFSKLVGWI